MRLLALAIAFLLVGAPVALAAGAPTITTPATSKLTGSPPPWLTKTATTPAQTRSTPARTATTAPVTTTASPAATTPTTTGTTAAATGKGNLPYTGDDLLPESLIAVALLAGGVALRLRWRRT